MPSKDRIESLTVLDNRTGKKVEISIEDNSVPATAFKQLTSEYAEGERVENDTPQGLRIYDPAYMNTAVIRSEITYIDGEKGILRYRGYPIEQLAEKCAYLLVYGELPSNSQNQRWRKEIMHHTYIAEDLLSMFSNMRYDAHPMSIFISAFAAMGAYAPEANPSLRGEDLYIRDKEIMNKQIIRIIGKAATVAAAAYRIRIGRPFNQPRSDLGYTENMLYMMDHMNEDLSYRPDPRLSKALDILFLLHADHEMNCSTATMTHVGSSLVDPYSAIAASAAALNGFRHGGANEAVVRMLEKIGVAKNVPAFIEKVKRKEALLFGFGHRIYRETDPRSKVIREVADMVFDAVGSKEPLIDVALTLRDAALRDDFFVKRRLYPNVDFFSGLIYKACGFPSDFFPVLFAVPRVVGYLAHWKQLLDSDSNKIWRPRQLYVGAGERAYLSVDERPERQIKNSKEGLVDLPHYMSKRRLTRPSKL